MLPLSESECKSKMTRQTDLCGEAITYLDQAIRKVNNELVKTHLRKLLPDGKNG